MMYTQAGQPGNPLSLPSLSHECFTQNFFFITERMLRVPLDLVPYPSDYPISLAFTRLYSGTGYMKI